MKTSETIPPESAEDRVIRCVRNILGYVGDYDIGPDTRLRGDLQADSLDIAELTMAIEDEFLIVLTGEEINLNMTVRDLAEMALRYIPIDPRKLEQTK